MKFTAPIALLAAMAAVTSAAPAPALAKRAAPGQKDIDTVILNYALTLEHLEATFYNDYLPSMDEFKSAGYPDYIYNRYVEIGGEELQHVAFLTSALGDKAVARCKYEFGLTGPESFITLSALLEGVGISAYLGAAANITDPAYLTAAASILSVEARHSAWIQSSAQLSDAFPAVFDTPLDFNQVYSLAVPFLKDCPKSNMALPVMAFPAATFSPTVTSRLQTVKVASVKLADGDLMGFISGLTTTIVPIKNNGMVTLPKEVGPGRSYAVILKKGSKTVTDDNTKAGPIVIDILPSAEKGAAYQQKAAHGGD